MARNTATSLLALLTNCFRHSNPANMNSPSNDAIANSPPVPHDRQLHDGSAGASASAPTSTPKDGARVCIICAETIKTERFCRPCRKCKKDWCHECVRNLFTAAIEDSERMPARCCQTVIHHSVAKEILDEETIAAYKLRYEECCTPRPFYCPVPVCSTFIPPRQLKSADHFKRLPCPRCSARLCTKCRQTAQPGHQCATAEDAVLVKIRALKYKRCPKCGTGVLKMYGCDHVRCHCGAHFCWSCCRPIVVCFSNPCQAQLDDGIDPEPDTDDEEDTAEADTRTAVTGPTDGIPYEHPTPSELALADAGQTAVAGAAFVLPPPRPLPAEIPELDSASAAAFPVADPAVPSTANASVESVADLDENLDDPDVHDWEYQDMDFGAEPTDERWDVWGCAHKYRRFQQEDVHEKWLKVEHLECQNCFEGILVHGPAGADVDSKVTDRLAWICKKCAVLYCSKCKRAVRAERKQ